MSISGAALTRAKTFCDAYELSIPVLMAPMAGACPPSLAISIGNAGGMGACGALLMQPEAINSWATEVRAATNGAFQLNTWIPDPAPVRNADHEAAVRTFLASWGPEVPLDAGDAAMPDFAAQCEAMLAAGPRVISSIMGLYPAEFVARMKTENIHWFATATTVAEAIAAESAGANVIVAQGMEAGGHRGAFNADDAESTLIGLFSLLPAVVDAVNIPVVATGGIADARAVAAALTLGASAVQIGTGLLRTPEAKTQQAWADAIGQAKPEDTIATRAFSGRLGRSLKTTYTTAAALPDAPTPAPYPIQRNLTAAMRDAGARNADINRMQTWAGQSSAYARTEPAGEIIAGLWEDAQRLLPG